MLGSSSEASSMSEYSGVSKIRKNDSVGLGTSFFCVAPPPFLRSFFVTNLTVGLALSSTQIGEVASMTS